MKWEELTPLDFARAVEQAQGLCLLPIGVIEPHPRLPLGAELFEPREIAVRAAQREPALVFPWYYFGEINSVKHMPGTVTLKGDMVIRLLTSVCEEISRNGLKKILIVNGHGFSDYLVFFTRLMLEEKRDFMVYLTNWWEDLEGHLRQFEMHVATELALNRELVKMEQAPEKEYDEPRGRYDHLPGLDTTVPSYGGGDGISDDNLKAVEEGVKEGQQLLEAAVKRLVRQIQAVKQDRVAVQRYKDFFDKCNH